jgi:hypothetical protein
LDELVSFMPVKRFKEGEGIGEQARVEVTFEKNTQPGADEMEVVVQLLENASRSGNFEGLLEPARRWASDEQANSDPDNAALAKRFNELTEFARAAKKHKNIDQAMWLAVKLGAIATEAGIRLTWGDDAISGRKVRDGGEKGHVKAYGTRQERYRKDTAIADAYRLARQIEGNKTQAKKTVANQFSCSPRTVERALNRAKLTD